MRIALKDSSFKWLEDILDEAFIDLDLANILRERAVQFIRPTLGHKRIAKESIRYIKVSNLSLMDIWLTWNYDPRNASPWLQIRAVFHLAI